MKDRAAAWLNEHFRGRGWDERDRDVLAALLVEVATEERERCRRLAMDAFGRIADRLPIVDGTLTGYLDKLGEQ